MTAYYVKNGGSNSNDGLADATAFATVEYAITSATFAASGNTIYLKRGSVFDEAVDAASFQPSTSGWTIDAYGDGPLPIWTRAKRDLTWTASVGGTYESTALVSNIGGCLTEDGVPLTWVTWNTNIATTAASMTPGSVTYDNASSLKYYIIPSTGTPNDHVYAATAGTRCLGVSSKTSWTIRNVEFQYAGYGLFCTAGSGYLIEDCVFRFLGAYAPSALLQGGGIAMVNSTGIATKDTVVQRCLFEDCFDEAVYPQTFDNSTTIQRLVLRDNVARRCGQFGFGVATIGTGLTNAIVRNVLITNNDVYDMGLGWSGDRGAIAYIASCDATDASSNISGVRIIGNRANDAEMGVSIYNAIAIASGNRLSAIHNYGVRINTSVKAITARVEGNIILGDGSTGIIHEGDNAGDIGITNNTVKGAWARGYRDSATAGASVLRNNAFIGNTIGLLVDGSITPTADCCAFWECGTDESGITATNSVTADPLVDAYGKPAAGSPWYGAGVFVAGAKHYGMVGMSPVSPDIGAYRYFDPRAVTDRAVTSTRTT